MSDMVLAILLGIAAAIAFGFVPVFARLGLVHLRTNTGVLTSMLAGLFVVGLFAVPLHIVDMFAISMLTLLWVAILGFANYRLGRFFNYTSVRLIGVARHRREHTIAKVGTQGYRRDQQRPKCTILLFL